VLSDRAVKETPIATIESISPTIWRMIFELVISGTGEVLYDRAVKEAPIVATESISSTI
jgi:hypothetical protein